MIATLTSKGQITIPVEIRRRLGLQIGHQVEFLEERDSVRLVRHVERAAMDEVRGCLRSVLKESSADYLTGTRGPALSPRKP